MKKYLFFVLFILTILLVGCYPTSSDKVVTFESNGTKTTVTVQTGELVEQPEDPVKNGYEFVGWYYNGKLFDFENTPITYNITIKAKFKAIESTDPEPENPTPENPTPENPTPENPTPENPTPENPVVETYTVTFKDSDGKVLKESKVNKNESAVAPTNPTKEGYNFMGWDKAYTNITSDLIVTATYEIKKYTVTFKDTDGKVLKEQTVDYNQSATAPTNPTKEGYSFIGWDKAYTNVKSDLVIVAQYEEVTVTYEVTFNVDGGIELDNMTVKAGEVITLPRTTKGGYLFNNWKSGNNTYKYEAKYTVNSATTFTAQWTANLSDLVYSGTNVTYRNTSTVVQIPTTYESKTSEFRAAWVSCYVGDYSASTDKQTMMANLTEVLNVLQSFNMNAVVFHIRIMNDACYNTTLAPIRNGFGTVQTFEEWDYLTWFIQECHARGIQFHAWLNPYRIRAYGLAADTTTQDVADLYKDYPENAASKAENILLTYRSDGTHGAILNPCKEEVQDYIVKVCLEIMRKYDVDAIHFDDYFYAQLSEKMEFLTEADQADYEAYIDANPKCGYSKTSSNNKQQWRRDNVDNFIEKLHNAMTTFNINNKRGVQLGIAPTGIYRNGNGKVTYNADGSVTTSGSNTGGQTHYSSYLFCDTVKWVRNEWIDYICPQSYWAFTHTTAGYADVVDWWSKVVEGTDVNLYTGMGLYMSTDHASSKSWYTEAYEASNQVLYNTKFNNVKGTCIYVYNRLKRIANDSSIVSNPGVMRIKNEYWKTYVPAPLTMADQYKG